MLLTSAGASALITNWAGSGDHEDDIYALAREFGGHTPGRGSRACHTQVPIGSIRGSLDLTAIFALEPGSRAARLDLAATPLPISGTSNSNNLIRKLRDYAG